MQAISDGDAGRPTVSGMGPKQVQAAADDDMFDLDIARRAASVATAHGLLMPGAMQSLEFSDVRWAPLCAGYRYVSRTRNIFAILTLACRARCAWF